MQNDKHDNQQVIPCCPPLEPDRVCDVLEKALEKTLTGRKGRF